MQKLSNIEAAVLNEDEQYRNDIKNLIAHAHKLAKNFSNSDTITIKVSGVDEIIIPFIPDTFDQFVGFLETVISDDADKVNESAVTETRPISQIASEIVADWKNVNYAAKSYLEAMASIDSIEDDYYQDTAASVVSYFLANAGSWRGENAAKIKAELKAMLKTVYG